MNMLVGNTLDIECMIQSLQNAVETKVEHDKARDEYHAGGGYSWGYFGRSYVDQMQNAAEEFGNRLNTFITAKVDEALKNRGVA